MDKSPKCDGFIHKQWNKQDAELGHEVDGQ